MRVPKPERADKLAFFRAVATRWLHDLQACSPKMLTWIAHQVRRYYTAWICMERRPSKVLSQTRVRISHCSCARNVLQNSVRHARVSLSTEREREIKREREREKERERES